MNEEYLLKVSYSMERDAASVKQNENYSETCFFSNFNGDCGDVWDMY